MSTVEEATRALARRGEAPAAVARLADGRTRREATIAAGVSLAAAVLAVVASLLTWEHVAGKDGTPYAGRALDSWGLEFTPGLVALVVGAIAAAAALADLAAARGRPLLPFSPAIVLRLCAVALLATVAWKAATPTEILVNGQSGLFGVSLGAGARLAIVAGIVLALAATLRAASASTFVMLFPGIGLLFVLFVAPLWYIFAYSVGMRTFAANAARAAAAGELTSFSTELWRRNLLGKGVILKIAGGIEIHMPLLVIGLILVALLAGAIAGGRVPHYGSWVVGGSLVLLLLPFLTVPAGTNLWRLAQIDSEADYLKLFFKSISMAMTSSVIAVVLAFPIAYYLAFIVQRAKYTWLLVVIAPFLTSYLLRVFAWKIILGDKGIINTGLYETGLRQVDHPLPALIYSQFTVMLVLTYAWVPFICLPIFIALENMDKRLLEAATDLGASRLTALRKVTLPIAAPGIVAAFLFVFIPSMGEYVTPSLVGGTDGYMYGNAVFNQFLGGTLDWQTGSVLALFLLVVVLCLTAATSRFLRAGGGAQ